MADSDWKTKVLGIGQTIVGGFLLLEGIKRVTGQPTGNLLGAKNQLGRVAGRGRGLGRAAIAPPVIQKATIETVRNIDERVGKIGEILKKSSLDPLTREDALRVLGRVCGTKYCVPEKNHLGEVKALFGALRDPRSPLHVRYVLDHVEVDQFAHRRVTKALHGEDCDGQVIALGAMLSAVGYPIKMRVVQTTDASTFNHIYLLVGLPPQEPTRWMALDPTVKQPPGWQVAGADEVAATGRPSGMVSKVKDYDVTGFGR